MSDEKIKEAEETYQRIQEKTLKIYEMAREACVAGGLDTNSIDIKIENHKKCIESGGLPEPKPANIFKNAMVDTMVKIDRWDEVTSHFVVNACDKEMILSALGDSLKPDLTENCIGSVWNALILTDPDCDPGMIIAVMEGKPVFLVSDMIAIADMATAGRIEGKTGYAYVKAY